MSRWPGLAGVACLALAGLLPMTARADGFADLKAALARPAAATPIKGVFKVEINSRQGDEKDSDEDRGQATLEFDDGPAGLRLTYPREMLARIDAETRSKDKDAKAKTPATTGMRAAEPGALRAMLSPQAGLLALLEDCVPKGEFVEAWNNRPARRLSCEYGIAKLKGKDRKYVKTYEGKVDIWIGATGLPLASTIDTKLTGRAYVVITFETSSRLEQTFQTVGERLVAVREERRSSGSGAGEKGESHSVREVVPAP